MYHQSRHNRLQVCDGTAAGTKSWPEGRLIRRLERDVSQRGRTADAVFDQYLDTVRPMHLEFVEPSKRWAHILIPEGGFNRVGVDMLVAEVRAATHPS